MAREAIKVVRDIIKEEMQLPNDDIIIYNQKWILPNDFNLMVVLGIVSELPYSSSLRHEYREGIGYFEIKEILVQQLLDVNIFSRDNSARLRKEEVLLALHSTFSQQEQEKESIKIFNLPVSFVNLSEVEGTAILNRFNININVMTKKSLEKEVEYFETFSNEEYISK